MSNTAAPTRPRTRTTNLPLILLWVASLAVAAIGYFVMMTGINTQVDYYGAASSQEPRDALTGQSIATLGGLLIGVGVLGLLIALAVHAHVFALARAQEAIMLDDFDAYGSELGENDIVHSTSTPAAGAGTTAATGAGAAGAGAGAIAPEVVDAGGPEVSFPVSPEHVANPKTAGTTAGTTADTTADAATPASTDDDDNNNNNKPVTPAP